MSRLSLTVVPAHLVFGGSGSTRVHSTPTRLGFQPFYTGFGVRDDPYRPEIPVTHAQSMTISPTGPVNPLMGALEMEAFMNNMWAMQQRHQAEEQDRQR